MENSQNTRFTYNKHPLNGKRCATADKIMVPRFTGILHDDFNKMYVQNDHSIIADHT